MDKFLENLEIKINNENIKTEFIHINKICMYIVHEQSVARKNPDKNKYCDILAYDDTRVKLRNDGYINANRYKKYILAQGPMDNYIADFWEMVYDNSPWIISLALEIENGVSKYGRYFETGSQTYGDFEVSLIESQSFTNANTLIFMHNKISVKKEKMEKIINHIQFYKWPDRSIPSVADFLYMYNYIKMRKNTEDKMTIHCSAGVGRTGTFCMIDTIVDLVENGNYNIKFEDILLDIRNHRDACVQTSGQYLFIHQCILTYFSNLE